MMSRPIVPTACLSSIFLVLGMVSLGAASDRAVDGVWTLEEAAEFEGRMRSGLTPWVQPQNYQAVRLSPAPLARILDHAPLEFSADAKGRQVVLSLPTPDGKFESFAIVVSPIMDVELEAWMAEQGWPMRTYRGVSLDHPATNVRLDWGGPGGFHASVHSPGRSYYIDPYWKGDRESHASYFTSEYRKGDRDFRCLVSSTLEPTHFLKSGATTAGNLRSYRLVVAATGEYTAIHGGTKVAGQAAIVTTVNRVNEVYENDLSIRMVLVGNNSDVVFTDGPNDPYTNNNGSAMLSENQTEVDKTIGTANYDIGHVVSTGGGGIASLGVPCRAGVKARGVTGSGNPVGDPFDIDYVAHEMGHQWGGNHTFNSETGSCGGGNRNGPTAYEPGSGSTIQAYAGICGVDNLQSNSDAYFHSVSLDEMLDYAAGSGACSTNTSAGNATAPTVDAGSPFTIPISSPFELSIASSDDLDGDTLTYTWEQFDLGPAEALTGGDNGSSPIFRSWPPTTSTSQLFPNDGVTPAAGETLPTTDRTMTFRVTVRDNNPGGGRVGEDSTTVTSTTSAGPFQVTAPNGGEIWSGTETATWDVAGTSGGAVNTPNVDILLSTDSGVTWPTTLVSGTPNDGTQSVTLPDVDTSAARVKIIGLGNIFFDTSDNNFTIEVETHTLSVYKTGTGAGTISSSPPGIACGDNCAGDFTVGENVTLTATPDAGSMFGGWSDACSGTGSCAVAMDSEKAVTASFMILGPGELTASADPATVNISLPSTINVGVTDGAGSPPPAGTAVTFSTTYPGFFSGNGCSSSFSPSSTVTDASGETWIQFASEVPGTANITVSSGNLSTLVPIIFVDPTPGMNVQPTVGFSHGTSSYSVYDVGAAVTDAFGDPVPYQDVTFGFSPPSAGYWQDFNSCDTGPGGTCNVDLVVTTAGEITITANAGASLGATTFTAYIGDPGSQILDPYRSFNLTGEIYGVEFTPDGSTLVASNYSTDTLYAWYTSNWAQRWTAPTDDNRPGQVSIDPTTGTYILVGTDNGTDIHQVSSGAFSCTGANTEGKGILGAWMSSSSYFGTGWETVYRHITVCGAGSATNDQMPAGHGFERAGHMDFTPQKNLFAACSDNGSMFVWNTSGNLVTQQAVASSANAYDTDFSIDGNKLVAVGWQTTKVFNTTTWTSTSYSAQSLGDDKFAVKFIDGDSKLAVGGTGKVEILNISDGSSFATANVSGDAVEMAWNPSTEELAVGTTAGWVYVFRPLEPPDTAPPLINITYPSEGAVTNDSTIVTTGRVTDGTSVAEFTINSTAVTFDAEGYFSHSVALAEGSNTITYFASDPKGNTTTETRTVTLQVDHTAPVISGAAVSPSTGLPGTPFEIQTNVVDGDTGVQSVVADVRDPSDAVPVSDSTLSTSRRWTRAPNRIHER